MLVDNNLKYRKKKKALLIDSDIIGKKDYKTEKEVFELAYLGTKRDVIQSIENTKEYKYILHILNFVSSDKVYGKLMFELDKYIHQTLEKSFQNKNFNKKVNLNHFVILADNIYVLYGELYKQGKYDCLKMEDVKIKSIHQLNNYLKLCKQYEDVSEDRFEEILRIKRYK